MENATTPTPQNAPHPLAPVVAHFAVPFLWFAAGWAVGRLMRPKRGGEG